MARRSDIDWEAIEAEYIAHQVSIRQISETHGVSDSQIRAKAKEHGWKRNLGDAIRKLAKEKIATINVAELIEKSAAESAEQSAATIKSAVEQASDIVAGKTLRHQKLVGASLGHIDALNAKISVMIDGVADIKELAVAATTVKTSAEATVKLVDIERRMYGVDDAPPPSVVTKIEIAPLV